MNTIKSVIPKLINTTLATDCFPVCFKQATVQPLIKKHSLDATVLIVHLSLQAYLELTNISKRFKSGFTPGYSIEIVLV